MRRAFLLTLLAASVLAASCSKDPEIYTQQEATIQNAVKRLLEEDESLPVTTNDGVTRVTLSPGSGAALGEKGKATVFYAAYNLSQGISSTSLVSTNVPELAEAAHWDVSAFDPTPVTLSLADKRLLDGIRKGLAGVQTGEECVVLFTAKDGRGMAPYGTIPAAAPLAFRFWIMTIDNE